MGKCTTTRAVSDKLCVEPQCGKRCASHVQSPTAALERGHEKNQKLERDEPSLPPEGEVRRLCVSCEPDWRLHLFLCELRVLGCLACFCPLSRIFALDLSSLFRTVGAPTVAAFVFLRIKDGLQQKGEGCDGRLVQALLSDASRMERFSIFWQCKGGRRSLLTLVLLVLQCEQTNDQ